MNKRRLLYAVILIIAILSIPFVAAAIETSPATDLRGSFEYKLDTADGRNRAEITKYLGESAENNVQGHSHVVEIPATVEIEGITYDMTAIGDGAFDNNRSITVVRMPDSIIKIGKNAFNCCTNLKTVVLSGAVA